MAIQSFVSEIQILSILTHTVESARIKFPLMETDFDLSLSLDELCALFGFANNNGHLQTTVMLNQCLSFGSWFYFGGF